MTVALDSAEEMANEHEGHQTPHVSIMSYKSDHFADYFLTDKGHMSWHQNFI